MKIDTRGSGRRDRGRMGDSPRMGKSEARTLVARRPWRLKEKTRK
jgi:hypothetical protein